MLREGGRLQVLLVLGHKRFGRNAAPLQKLYEKGISFVFKVCPCGELSGQTRGKEICERRQLVKRHPAPTRGTSPRHKSHPEFRHRRAAFAPIE